MKSFKNKFLLFIGAIISFLFNSENILSQTTPKYGIGGFPIKEEPKIWEEILSFLLSPVIVSALAIVGAITILVGIVVLIVRIFKKKK